MTVTAQIAPPPRRSLYWRFNRFLERTFPAGLYQSSLIIVVVTMVLMQAIMVGIILDRLWDNVTRVLAKSLAREIGFVIDQYDTSAKTPEALAQIECTAHKKMRLGLTSEHTPKIR